MRLKFEPCTTSVCSVLGVGAGLLCLLPLSQEKKINLLESTLTLLHRQARRGAAGSSPARSVPFRSVGGSRARRARPARPQPSVTQAFPSGPLGSVAGAQHGVNPPTTSGALSYAIHFVRWTLNSVSSRGYGPVSSSCAAAGAVGLVAAHLVTAGLAGGISVGWRVLLVGSLHLWE